MTLRIDRFVIRCQVSRRHQALAQMVDRFARERLPGDLAQHLGPSLSRQPAIVRIRYLPVRLRIPAAELNEESLSRAWTEAFARALFTALTYPTGVGSFDVFRVETVAEFVASAIRDLLSGTTDGHWEYAEFAESFRLGSVEGALALLCGSPDETLSILLALERMGTLDVLLPRLDDLALERLFKVLAHREDAEPSPLTLADLFTAARLALASVHLGSLGSRQGGSSLRSRRHALRLYVHARRRSEAVRSPRALFHALLTLHHLLDYPESFEAVEHHPESDYERHVPPAVVSTLREIRGTMASSALRRAEFLQALQSLRVGLQLPAPTGPGIHVRRVSSEWCGLFLLCETLQRLGWVPAWQEMSQFQTGGISPILAALALAITGRFSIDPSALDPGLALFSGYTAAPDLVHLRNLFQEDGRELRRSILRVAYSQEPPDDAVGAWPAMFDALAETLIRNFAARVRGFRQASRASVVRTFLRRGGTIRVEKERIVVVPDPSPFDVALRISAIDTAIDSVVWLGGRRLEFHIEGL